MAEEPLLRFTEKQEVRHIGNDLELLCWILCPRRPEVSWFHDDYVIEEKGRFYGRADEVEKGKYALSLYMKGFDRLDAGEYRCIATTADYRAVADFSVKMNPPTFIEKPSTSWDLDQNTLMLQFKTKSLEPPTFSWTRDKGELDPTAKQSTTEEPEHEFFCSLVISPTEPEDGGIYTCTVTNQWGSLKANFRVHPIKHLGKEIQLLRPPMVLQKKNPLQNGDFAIGFDIGFRSKHNPYVVWFDPKGNAMVETPRVAFHLIPHGSNSSYSAQMAFSRRQYTEQDLGTYRYGTVEEKNNGIIAKIYAFFAAILLFFQSLLCLDSNTSRDGNERNQLRRGNPAGGGRWDSAALDRSNDRGGIRRNIGRLRGPSGIAAPPSCGPSS